MEQIGTIRIITGQPLANASQTTLTSSLNTQPKRNWRQDGSVSGEKLTAMLDVLKSRWQTKGWHPMVKDDSEPMALEFIKALDRYSIPFQHYRELYDRSIDLRSRRLGQGLPCDDFSADLMIACWQGLKADLKQREIDAGRTLTGHAQSQCPKCLGTGMERLTDSQGRVVVRAGCQHEFTEDEQDAMDGLSMLEEALKRPERSETASQVITRLRRAVAFDFINAEHDTDRANSAWEAQKILLHAANYVKGLEGA